MISFSPDQVSIHVLSSRKLIWTQARNGLRLSARRLKTGEEQWASAGGMLRASDLKQYWPVSLASSSEKFSQGKVGE